MEFSRQEYWSGLPFPHPKGLPNPSSPALQADSLLSHQGTPLEIYDHTKIPERLFFLLRHNDFFPDSMGLKKNIVHLRR